VTTFEGSNCLRSVKCGNPAFELCFPVSGPLVVCVEGFYGRQNGSTFIKQLFTKANILRALALDVVYFKVLKDQTSYSGYDIIWKLLTGVPCNF
jgi:hypothetical protein